MVSPQSAVSWVSRSCSLWSVARFQRSLVAVHSEAYRHSALVAGGSHWAGSWSLLERLERAVTVTRLESCPRSLA